MNREYAATFVDALVEAGLQHACVSPGSRSGPLAVAMARHPRLRVWVHVDERCSGFFAVGLAKQLGAPVAVLTTSGTAVAELHAAVIEAHHSRTPLLVLSADRPPEAHERGANQTIEQARLFGTATRWSFDPGPAQPGTPARVWAGLAARALATARGPIPGPVHLNLPFREPLHDAPDAGGSSGAATAAPVTTIHQARPVPDPVAVNALAELLAGSRRPYLHAGTLPHDPGIGAALAQLSERCGLVVHAEPVSGLRTERIQGVLRHAEALLRDPEFSAQHRPDLVVRIGGTPVSRTVNQWLADSAAPTVLIDPAQNWPDPDSLATEIVQADVASTLGAAAGAMRVEHHAEPWREAWAGADSAAAAAIDRALADAPLFEAQAIRAVAEAAPTDATLVLGSSMPVRDADWFWPLDDRRFLANRGASGIDGFISTALGAAAGAQPRPLVAVCGDLSLYHDLNGLLAARTHALPAAVVVLNNQGGGIFEFLPEASQRDVFETVFATPTGLDLGRAARLFDLGFERTDSPEAITQVLQRWSAAPAPLLVEVPFARADSVSGHRAVWAAVSAAIRAVPPAAPGT